MPEVLPDDRLLMLCDSAVEFIDAGWTDQGDDDGVERTYIPTLNLTGDVQPVHKGRRLYVMPQVNDPIIVALITRDEQERKYTFNVLMVERYVAGDGEPETPPREWVDERVKWYMAKVFNRLANPTTELAERMVPDLEETPAVRVMVDRVQLDQHKTFWAWAEFPYAENTDLSGEVSP